MKQRNNAKAIICRLSIFLLALHVVNHKSYARDVPALIAAIRQGDANAVERECVSNHVNAALKPGDKWDYPLIEACNHTNLTIIKLLIANGADVNVASRDNLYGNSPVMISVNLRQVAAAVYLIKHGANPEGVTPLMLAVIARDLKTIKQLASDKANLNQKNIYGYDALEYAHPNR